MKQNRIDRFVYLKNAITIFRGFQEATILLDNRVWEKPVPLENAAALLNQLRLRLSTEKRNKTCERTLREILADVEHHFRDCNIDYYKYTYDESEDRIHIDLELAVEYPRRWK